MAKQINELFGFSSQDQATKQAQELGNEYLNNRINAFYKQYVFWIQDGSINPDAAGFARFRTYFNQNYSPEKPELDATKLPDPASFDNKTVYNWIAQAIKTKNSFTAPVQPAAARVVWTLKQILSAIGKLNAADVKKVMHELQALGYRLNDQTQNKKPKSPKNP